MKKSKPEPIKTTSIRNRAEEALRKQKGRAIPAQDAQDLIHELQVHQIELEMQNEELRNSQVLLEESRSKYSNLYEFAPVGYFTLDNNGLILEANLTGADMLGVQKNVLMKKPFTRFVHKDDRDKFYFHNKKIIETKIKQVCEIRLQKKDGVIFYVQLESLPILAGKEKDMQTRMAVSNITDRKKMEEIIRHQAFYDELTGLPNRKLFTDHLNLAISQARRSGNMLAVLFLDLDNFKTINDSLGHPVGDQLLIASARRLQSCLRKSDTVARFGGDEFVILLPETTHVDDVVATTEKIISAFQEMFLVDDNKLYVTVSIGICFYPLDGKDVDTLLKNADTAMYKAKEQGKNIYKFYNNGMNSKVIENMRLGNRLRKAVESGELVVHYQPQINMNDRQMAYAEALVRWQHPEMGLLHPPQFIPLVEETGNIALIDEWMLRTVCKQNKKWQDEGGMSVCVMVNFSGKQFYRSDPENKISQILRETGLAPEFLGLEIAEHTTMQDIESSRALLTGLKKMGVRFAIDNFGVGSSSLSCLKKLPVQVLKIDRSFIHNLAMDPDYRSIVTAIISMAHSLNLKVVAGGVETEEQWSFLDSIDCDGIQGYLISKPLPVDEFSGFIRAAHG